MNQYRVMTNGHTFRIQKLTIYKNKEEEWEPLGCYSLCDARLFLSYEYPTHDKAKEEIDKMQKAETIKELPWTVVSEKPEQTVEQKCNCQKIDCPDCRGRTQDHPKDTMNNDKLERVKRRGICLNEAQNSYENMMDGQAILWILNDHKKLEEENKELIRLLEKEIPWTIVWYSWFSKNKKDLLKQTLDLLNRLSQRNKNEEI